MKQFLPNENEDHKRGVKLGRVTFQGRCPMDGDPVSVEYQEYRLQDNSVIFDTVEAYGGQEHHSHVREMGRGRRMGIGLK